MRPVIVCLLGTLLLVSGCDTQSPARQQAAAPAPAPQSGGLDTRHKGEPIPAVTVVDPAGHKLALPSLKGKPLLLNLWATWCAPCIQEMPTLDALAAHATGLQVVAVSQDLDGAAKVQPFFAAHRFRALHPWLDSDAALSTGLGVNLPTTIRYDASGKEVWRWSGPLDWTGDKARAMLAADDP